jgi:Na+-transporting methylmalonyl-CoA/oxaloacetate decarboxylase gamma subunit
VDLVVALIIVVLLAAVVWIVGAPLRRGVAEEAEGAEVGEREELEAEKEAKYREIRDAELDHRTGKLSDEDWRAVDRQLRAEAMSILRKIDRLGS